MAKKASKVVSTIRLDSDIDKQLNQAVRESKPSRSKNSLIEEAVIEWLERRKK